MKKNSLKIIFIIYLAILIKLIFFKRPWQSVLASFKSGEPSTPIAFNLIPFETIQLYLNEIPGSGIAITNLLGNIIIFIPLGFLLPLLAPKINSYKKIIIISAAFSLFLEITQATMRLGSFDIDDLILNTAGALMGYFTYKKFTAKTDLKNQNTGTLH